MKKSFVLVLAALLILGAFTACQKETPPASAGDSADINNTNDAVTDEPNEPEDTTDAAESDPQPEAEDIPAPEAQTSGNYTNEMKIPYGTDISAEDGANSVERLGDHVDSPYFSRLDFYNMESTDTLTILPKFQTVQQTSEWSCGVTCVLMAMNYYDMLGEHDEYSLALLRPQQDTPGATTLGQAIAIFDAVGGFELETTLDYGEDVYTVFDFDFIQEHLAAGIPILVCWNDWGGHWQIIIGYDTMGTEATLDDVLIMADPYDTTDHNQDGYGVYGAERFYYNFTMYDFFSEEDGNDMLFIAVKPAN